ncbi:MAG: tRNA adenosine(34) deaminase TadA [bacterium]
MDQADFQFMGEALAEAQTALTMGEVPVGCVIVSQGRIVGRGHNLRESREDPTAHAEMTALRQAASEFESWRVSPACCYVTLEPCPMCAGALVNARVDRLVFGCKDPKAGAVETLYQIASDPRLNHRLEVVSGVREDECARLLTDFFRGLR